MTSMGVSLSAAIGDEPVGFDDLTWFAGQLTLAFKIRYLQPDTVENARCLQVWELAKKQGLTRPEFQAAVEMFLATKPFPNWAPADVLLAKRPKVYPHVWYTDQIEKNRSSADAIGCFDLKGAPVWGWKHEVGERLPVWTVEKASTRGELGDGRPHMEPDTKETFDAMMKRLRQELAEEEPINPKPPAPLWDRDDQPFAE